MISILPMESLNVDDPLHTMRELLHYYHKRSTITLIRRPNPGASSLQVLCYSYDPHEGVTMIHCPSLPWEEQVPHVCSL